MEIPGQVFPQGGEAQGHEAPCLSLVAVRPVAVSDPLREIARDAQPAAVPLPEHMEILVQHQRRVIKELARRPRQQDAIAPRGCAGATVQAGVPGILDHLDIVDPVVEELVERRAQALRHAVPCTHATADPTTRSVTEPGGGRGRTRPASTVTLASARALLRSGSANDHGGLESQRLALRDAAPVVNVGSAGQVGEGLAQACGEDLRVRQHLAAGYRADTERPRVAEARTVE